MKKVLIPTKLNQFAATLLAEKSYEVIQDSDSSLEDLIANHSDSEILIVRSEKISDKVIDQLPKLRLIVRAGAGYNTIDTKYARRKNIDVMNTPGANSNAVAEEVIALILAGYRHITAADASTRAGLWEKKRFMGRELTGKTIGIIGLGNIGRLLVKRLEGFQVKILGYDPMISAAYADELGIELASLEKIFSNSDLVSLHIPENDETRGIINYSLLNLMKNEAALINCARSGIIDEADLRKIKSEKKLLFLNDVYPQDKAGEKSVTDIADIMLPHLGASTREANFNAAKRAAEQTIDYFEEGITTCVVNKGVPDGLNENYQHLAFVLTKIAKGYLGKNQHPSKIETSFYGDLNPYAKWLIAPVAAAISSQFDLYQDAADAESFLESRGITWRNREIDSSKDYGKAMTIDVYLGDGSINRVSVRGTITENNLMVSRLKHFDKLYLEPTGHNLFIEYTDAPGVLGKIASILGDKNINILDLRAPQDLNLGNSLAVIKTNTQVPEVLLKKIKQEVNASHAFLFSYNT